MLRTKTLETSAVLHFEINVISNLWGVSWSRIVFGSYRALDKFDAGVSRAIPTRLVKPFLCLERKRYTPVWFYSVTGIGSK